LLNGIVAIPAETRWAKDEPNLASFPTGGRAIGQKNCAVIFSPRNFRMVLFFPSFLTGILQFDLIRFLL